MVVTKSRPSGDLAIKRARFNPSAAGVIVNSAGSINENGLFPFKRTTCGVSFPSGADCDEHTDGTAATDKATVAAMRARIVFFMNKIVPSNRHGFEIKAEEQIAALKQRLL